MCFLPASSLAAVAILCRWPFFTAFFSKPAWYRADSASCRRACLRWSSVLRWSLVYMHGQEEKHQAASRAACMHESCMHGIICSAMSDSSGTCAAMGGHPLWWSHRLPMRRQWNPTGRNISVVFQGNFSNPPHTVKRACPEGGPARNQPAKRAIRRQCPTISGPTCGPWGMGP